MQDGRNITEQYAYRTEDSISPVCLVMSGLLIVVLGVLPVAPTMLVRALRPVFILACILFPSMYSYKLTFERWQLASMAYYTIIFIFHDITRNAIFVYVSLVLFILFFIFSVKRFWTRKEIVQLLYIVIVACDIQAFFVLVSNPNLFSANGSDMINYLSVSTNRNPIAFAIVPGALCCLLFLTHSRNANRGIKLILLTGSFWICSFTVFAIGCRSAFGSLALGSVLLLINAISEEQWAERRIMKIILMIIFVILIIFIARRLSMGTYSERIFDLKFTDSGRERIWRRAGEMIRQKPFFGGGYDYWISGEIDMGTHNTFLLTALYTGYVGVALLVIFLLSITWESLRLRAWCSLAFLVETLFHSYTETSMDYYAYIPLILAIVLLRYMQGSNRNLHSLFRTDL